MIASSLASLLGINKVKPKFGIKSPFPVTNDIGSLCEYPSALIPAVMFLNFFDPDFAMN